MTRKPSQAIATDQPGNEPIKGLNETVRYLPVWQADLETLEAEIDAPPLDPMALGEELVTLEALTGYVREQSDAVRARVLERWVETFEAVPGPFTARAFRSWDRGDRLPNPVELRNRALEIRAEAVERLRLHRDDSPAEDVNTAPAERLSAKDRAAIVRAHLAEQPHNRILQRLLREIEGAGRDAAEGGGQEGP